MENFNEDLLSANDLSAFECFSVTENRDRVLKKVEQLGDEELSLAYKAFFNDENEDLKESLKQLYQKDEQLKLVQESLKLGDSVWIKRLVKNKSRAINWYVEKLIAEMLDEEIISLLLNRQLGWSAQAIIAEQNNDSWTLSLIEHQRGLSFFVKEYVIDNSTDKCVLTLINRKNYVSPDIQVSIVKKRNNECIKTLLKRHKQLPSEVLVEIIKLGDKELMTCLTSRTDLDDKALKLFIKNADFDTIEKYLKYHHNNLPAFIQRDLILTGNPKLISYVAKQTYRIPDFRVLIIKSLDISLIKEFVLKIKKLSWDEIDIIKSIGTKEMLGLIN